MIRIQLITEGRVVKQISSRVHETVVLEQLKKYQGTVDEIVYEGELSEGAKEILQKVAKRVIPAAMAAGIALGGANSAQAQNMFPGTDRSIGQHISDIFSPNYREIQRQRRADQDARRAEQDAYNKEIRRARVDRARQQGRQDGRAYSGSEMPSGTKVYDQARLSGDGRSIILYDLDHRVTRIDRNGTEFIPADSQRLAHYITRGGQVYYVRHAATTRTEGVEGIVEDPTVGTIPANGGGSSGSTIKPTGSKGPTPNTPNKATTQPDEEEADIQLDKDHGLDKQTLDAIKKAGVAVDIKEEQPSRLEQRIRGIKESVKTTHEDPLVTVHDDDGLHTHANLSVANGIFNTRVKASDVHRGAVKVTSGREDKKSLKFAISKHHKSAVEKDSVNEGFTDPKLQDILDKHQASWQAFKSGGDVTDNQEFYDELFAYFSDNGEMPYGVAKARDGDPVNWITNALDRLAGNEEIGEMKDDDMDVDQASAADQASADKNIIMQIRKAADYEKPTKISLEDGTGFVLDARKAKKILNMFDQLKPDSKLLMQQVLNKQDGIKQILGHLGESVTESGMEASLQRYVNDYPEEVSDNLEALKAKAEEEMAGTRNNWGIGQLPDGRFLLALMGSLKKWGLPIKAQASVGEGEVVAFRRPQLKGDAQNLQAAKELAKELYWHQESSHYTPEDQAAEKELQDRLAKMGYEAESDLDTLDHNIVITHKATGKQYRMGEDELLADSINEAPQNVAQYTSLADVYPEGSTEIWYWKEDFARDAMMGAAFMTKQGVLPTPETIPNNYVLIGKVRETNPDKIFHMMQGEIWSPEGQARNMISASGTGHTSMSVGDIIKVGNKWLMVDRYGFQDLSKSAQAETVQFESTYFDPKKTAAVIVSKLIEDTFK